MSDKLLKVILLFTFVIIDNFRRFIGFNLFRIQSEGLWYLNFIFIALLIVLTLYNFKNKMINWIYIYIFIFLQISFFINAKLNFISYQNIVFVEVFTLIPLLFLALKFNYKTTQAMFYYAIKYINIIIFLYIITGGIDYITNRGVQRFLANINYFNEMFKIQVGYINESYRYFSFIGHPLRACQFVLMFYCLNKIYIKIYNEIIIKSWMINLISLIGVLLSSSKSGIIVIIMLILIDTILENKKYKILSIFTTFSILIGATFTNFFENTVVTRFKNTNLFSSRGDILNYIHVSYFPDIKLWGNGYNYSSYLLSLMETGLASLEYPILIYLYEYGFVFTILIYIVLVIIPAIKILKYKQIHILIYFFALTTFVNTYNGITVNGDYMIQYVVFISIIINAVTNKKSIVMR